MTATATELRALGQETLSTLGAIAPTYDRRDLPLSVLHLGPGAFFRAHQADYFDRLNVIDPSWGIRAIALRTSSVPEALTPQDGLYTLVTLDRHVSARVTGALKEVLFLGNIDPEMPFLEPGLKLLTLTITEKGYCLGSDGGLDFDHADIRHDLETKDRPRSAIGLIVKGLAARRAAGLPTPGVLSCDNLPNNGGKLRAAVVNFAAATDTKLAQWISETVAFPSSMVDSITPATNDTLRARVSDIAGIHDAWPIQREAFTSWVIETPDGAVMPPLDRVGVVFTTNVAAHEQAKLRMLNGSHSTLAYVGLAKGFATVADAMADPRMSGLIDELMAEEIAPSVVPPPGLDLDQYRHDLIARFRNPAIAHKLSQIAWDASKKLPIRLLDTMLDNIAAGRPIACLALGVAAWIRFVVRTTQAGEAITDPMAEQLVALGNQATGDAGSDVSRFLELEAVFPAGLASDAAFRRAVEAGYAEVLQMEEKGA